MTNSDGILALEAADVSLIIDAAGPAPRVLHWGRGLGEMTPGLAEALRLSAIPAALNNSPDVARSFTVLPAERDGWPGTPGQEGRVVGIDVVH
ncbi:hypothetical protein SB717_34970, partial [Priestia sp. SIMBA_032]|uniref:hypothetical protein n=1 Tax=Priestia sp. SIMBA_032 TaxID=3085775 RepID=UPI00397D835A